MEYSYKFPVVRGRQALRDYYIAMVPLKMISKLFPNDDEYVLPEHRAQRKLNVSRIPSIRQYILDNRDNYVFSALSASIDGEYFFEAVPSNENVGVLEVSLDAKFLINDGQHRKAAILEAIREDDTLQDETISIVFFEDKGLARSQQMFTDLNKHAVKTSNSIAELYDSRDELAVVTRRVVSRVPFLNSYTDKEKDILGKYSSNLFTLNTFYSANKRIIRRAELSSGIEEFLYDYWIAITERIRLWRELELREISKIDLREIYIVTQSVIIQVFGRLGNYFLEHKEIALVDGLKALEKIDWRRDAAVWQLRTIRANGRMINSESAIILTCNAIKTKLNLPLDNEEDRREQEFIKRV